MNKNLFISADYAACTEPKEGKSTLFAVIWVQPDCCIIAVMSPIIADIAFGQSSSYDAIFSAVFKFAIYQL
jgi:hypothetical protein